PDLNEPSLGFDMGKPLACYCSQKCFCGAAPDVIDHNLKTGLAGFARKRIVKFLRRHIEANGGVSAMHMQCAQDRWVASRSNDALPVLKMSTSVRTADQREFARTCIMQAAGQLLVDRFQRSGVNVHDYFTVPGNWLQKFFVSRHFAKPVQNGCVHRSFLATCPPLRDSRWDSTCDWPFRQQLPIRGLRAIRK